MLKSILCALQPQLATTLYGSDTMESEGTVGPVEPTTEDELATILDDAMSVLPTVSVATPEDEYGALRKAPLSPETRRANLKHLFPAKEPTPE